jgi:hypothetical protein
VSSSVFPVCLLLQPTQSHPLRATRAFRDQREAELKKERDAAAMEKFRAEIAYRSSNRSY